MSVFSAKTAGALARVCGVFIERGYVRVAASDVAPFFREELLLVTPVLHKREHFHTTHAAAAAAAVTRT